MKNNILIIIAIVLILIGGGVFYKLWENQKNNWEGETTQSGEQSTIAAPEWKKLGQYRRLESNLYTVNKKDSENYEICITWKPDVCISLLQFGWPFELYYSTIVPAEEKQPEQSINSTIQWKKERKCVPHIETEICFNENTNWTLIMVVSDLRGEWFFWWEYDPKDILRNIDF